MLRKSRIWKMFLLVVVIVLANVYLGCLDLNPQLDVGTHKHYEPEGSQEQLKQRDAQIEEMQKEIEELKRQR